MTAAITSAGGFCALWAAGFQGFQQLGTLLAGGVLLCLISVLLVLPLLILWREKGATPVPLRVLSDTGEKSSSRYRFAPIGLVAIALVTVVAAIQVPNVRFEYDISELRARGLSYSDLDEEKRSHAQDSYAPILVSYPDDASLRTAHQAYQNRIDDCAALEQCEQEGVGCETLAPETTCDLSYVGQVLSVYSLVPLEQTEQSLHLKEFHKTLEQNKKFLIHPIYENLVPIVDRLAAIDAEPVQIADLPMGFQRWLSPGDGSSHRLMLIPKGNMWNIQNNVSLKEEVESSAQGEKRLENTWRWRSCIVWWKGTPREWPGSHFWRCCCSLYWTCVSRFWRWVQYWRWLRVWLGLAQEWRVLVSS